MNDRPRLADHALLRRHVVDGVERFFIHHAQRGSLVVVDERGVGLLLLADGTRDVQGIALGAARAGLAPGGVPEIEAFFSALEQHELLDDGGAAAPIAAPAVGVDLAARPVSLLPDYLFRCDGGGACCNQYGSVAFSADDVRRARRAGLRTLPGDLDGERVFLPLHGSLSGGRAAMTLVDGSCLQLDASRRCALQVAGGAEAKPVACRMFPATFADDGESLRVSVALECDCAISSLVASSGAEGLLSPLVRLGADLPAGISVRVLPDPVAIAKEHVAPRRELVRWVDEVLANAALDPALLACFALAGALDAGSLTAPGSRAIEQATLSNAAIAAQLAPYLEEIAASMRAASEAADSWRSAHDRTRLLRRSLARAASALLARGIEATLDAPLPAEPPGAPGPSWAQVETFALRAALFGHQLADARPFADALRMLAAKLVLARELGLAGGRELGHPLACVMATLRGAL